MGATPVTPAAPAAGKGLTLDQLKAQGATPVDPRDEILKHQQTQAAQPKHGNFLSNVGNALTSSEQTLGKGLSTVFDKNTQRTVDQTNQQDAESQQKLIEAIHTQSDPVKKQHLVDTLKNVYGKDYKATTQTDLNPAFGMSNKEVAGAALGTALDVGLAGSFGSKGAETGKLLTKSPAIAGVAEKAGIATTQPVAKTIEEIAAESAKKTATQSAVNVAKDVTKGAATGYGYDVAGNAQANKDNVFKPGLGTAVGAGIPLAAEAVKGLGYIAKEVAKHASSTLSGVPKDAIEHAFQNPEAVQSAMRKAAEDPDNSAQKILSNAQEAMDTLKKARSDAYQQGLEKLQNETSYTKNGQLYVKRALTDAEAKGMKGYVPGTKIGVPTNLNTSGIKKVFTSTLKDFGAEGGGKGGIDFTNVAIDDAHISKLEKLQQRIYNWTDSTPTGINRLRQVVDSYKLGGINLGSSEKKFNSIIGDLRTNLAGYVGEKVPQVAEMNSKYAAESSVIDNITAQLKLNTKDPNTALRKLLNVFNPKSTVYRPIVEQLGEKGAKDLMSDIAGLTMAKWTPEGLAKYFGGAEGLAALLHPAALPELAPVMAASSPRVVGEVTTGLGKIAQNKTAQKAADITGKTASVGKKLLTRNAGLSK